MMPVNRPPMTPWLAFLVHTAAAKQPSAYKRSGLAFLHIPKSAGATIETKTGRRMAPPGVNWHFHVTYPGHKAPRSCPYWHVPPRYLGNASTYEPNSTWCVVRDPADRALSAFKERVAPDAVGDAKQASAWLLKTLAPGVFPVGRQCHLVPQSTYVFDAAGARTCAHALRFERLPDEFDALMERYGVPWRWAESFGDTNRMHHAPSNLTVAALEPAAIARVRAVYRDDYCALGYDAAACGRRP